MPLGRVKKPFPSSGFVTANEPVLTVYVSLAVLADPIKYVFLFSLANLILEPGKALLCFSASDIGNESFQ